MFGGLKESELANRSARQQLKHGIHWRLLDAGVHLGYHKLATGGEWLVRWYIGNGNYIVRPSALPTIMHQLQPSPMTKRASGAATSSRTSRQGGARGSCFE